MQIKFFFQQEDIRDDHGIMKLRLFGWMDKNDKNACMHYKKAA